MFHGGSEDPFSELKEFHRDYKVFDGHYERVGKVDELFVDEADHPIYLGVSTGILESGSILIPMDLVRINDKRGVVEVDAPRKSIEDAPKLGSRDEISPETEDMVRVHYGLEPLHSSPRHSESHAGRSGTEDRFAFDERIDLLPGEREATQKNSEGDPPYRERDEQLLRNRQREDADREAADREAAEREMTERQSAERKDARNDPVEAHGSENTRGESQNHDGKARPKVRRLIR